MMSGHYSFTSCFAPFIESMITEKRNAGFQYEHAEWILHKFDEFCNQEQVETPVITQELAGKWGTLRKTETKVTLAGRISVLRQLSLYMQAYGIKCYIPRNFTRKSNRSAYVLSIEEIQSLFLEIDSYQPTINAEVFHRLALEYRILFRVLFCCGLRVSEARKLRLDTVDLENGVLKILLWSSIFVTLMANKIGGLQFGIYRNCQISSRVFHTAVAALPLTKANRSDFE